MKKPTPISRQLFLFNTRHAPFVNGETPARETALTLAIMMRRFVVLVLMIGLPIIITITLLVLLTGEPIQLVLPVQIVVLLCFAGVVVVRDYSRDRALQNNGQVIFGEVIRQDLLPGYANIGSSLATRIIYRFMTPEQERVIDKVDLSYVGFRMPDGRKYPDAGTRIAVLYANQRNYKLL